MEISTGKSRLDQRGAEKMRGRNTQGGQGVCVKFAAVAFVFSDGDVHDRTTSDHVVLGACHWLKRLWRHSKPLQSPQSHIHGSIVYFWSFLVQMSFLVVMHEVIIPTVPTSFVWRAKWKIQNRGILDFCQQKIVK